MKPIVKWILAIVLGLIVLLAVPGVFLLVWRLGFGGHMSGFPMMRVSPLWGHYPGMMLPFSGFGLLLRCLIPAGFLVLVVLGVVALVKGLGRTTATSSVAAPAPISAPVSTLTPAPAPELAPERTCANCGKPVQADWSVCPYCGHALSS